MESLTQTERLEKSANTSASLSSPETGLMFPSSRPSPTR